MISFSDVFSLTFWVSYHFELFIGIHARPLRDQDPSISRHTHAPASHVASVPAPECNDPGGRSDESLGHIPPTITAEPHDTRTSSTTPGNARPSVAHQDPTATGPECRRRRPFHNHFFMPTVTNTGNGSVNFNFERSNVISGNIGHGVTIHDNSGGGSNTRRNQRSHLNIDLGPNQHNPHDDGDDDSSLNTNMECAFSC